MFLTQVQSNITSPIQAYAVCVRFRQTMLLHKPCVAEAWRCRGLGKYLMNEILQRARSQFCRYIEPWVEESQVAAKHSYLKCGILEMQITSDYYVVGRHAVKMALKLDS